MTSLRPSRFGLISDTHGLLRPEAAAALRGCERILHAGDIGGPEILERLRRIAPVRAVRGNNDRDAWAHRIPATRVVRIGRHRLFLVHDLLDMDFDPAARGFRAVLSGHSHRPSVDERGGVLFVNPGSAGPRRFRLPVTVARLELRGSILVARIIEIEA